MSTFSKTDPARRSIFSVFYKKPVLTTKIEKYEFSKHDIKVVWVVLGSFGSIISAKTVLNELELMLCFFGEDPIFFWIP